MINELESIWKEAVVTYSRYYTGLCLDELRKPTINLIQDCRCPDRDSNRHIANMSLGHHRYAISPAATVTVKLLRL
jgi:hypothetical protein